MLGSSSLVELTMVAMVAAESLVSMLVVVELLGLLFYLLINRF